MAQPSDTLPILNQGTSPCDIGSPGYYSLSLPHFGKQKHRMGHRSNRVTAGGGFWKATGKDKLVFLRIQRVPKHNGRRGVNITWENCVPHSNDKPSFLLQIHHFNALLGTYIGDTALAVGLLAIAFANIIGYSVLKGLATGMEPICYQAFGAKKWSVLIQTYRKTLCLLLVASIPITLLWLKMEPILLWLGQDKTLTAVAQVYITYSIPELLAQAHLHPLRTFLRTQNINRPLTLAAISAMILHYPINYFLVIYLNLGVKGVALASALNSINTNLGLLVYLLLSEKALKPWDGASINTFSEGWQQLLVLVGPSVLSVCLEWWWYEIMSIMCGWLSNPKANVAAMGILIGYLI